LNKYKGTQVLKKEGESIFEMIFGKSVSRFGIFGSEVDRDKIET
jgi:hypothetical protein